MRHSGSERDHQNRKQSDEAAELADEATAHEADVDFRERLSRRLCHAWKRVICARCVATAATYCSTGPALGTPQRAALKTVLARLEMKKARRTGLLTFNPWLRG